MRIAPFIFLGLAAYNVFIDKMDAANFYLLIVLIGEVVDIQKSIDTKR